MPVRTNIPLRYDDISPSFFCNDTATTAIFTLSLHDALPISPDQGEVVQRRRDVAPRRGAQAPRHPVAGHQRRLRDRKSTRLNSSHTVISYAVFCLKKKNIYRKNLWSALRIVICIPSSHT